MKKGFYMFYFITAVLLHIFSVADVDVSVIGALLDQSRRLLPVIEACCSRSRHTFGEMSRSLPDRVAGLYYAHGLLCSSHPVVVIPLAISVLLLCW